jgi:hypothetical protein
MLNKNMGNKFGIHNKICLIFSVEIFLASVYASILFILTLDSPIWGYDEFGTLITHLELDDKRLLDLYKRYASGLIGGGLISEFALNLIFSIFVVPLRWTYSIGISPLYGLIRVADIDWHYLRIFLLSIQIFFNSVALYFLLKYIQKLASGRQTQLLVFVLIALSPTYLYWTNTLSSYAFHLPAFVLLLGYFYNRSSEEYRIMNKHSISAGLAQLLNYQYIFVFLAIGFYDFVTNSSASVRNRVRILLFPTLVAFLSLSFLYARSLILGVHKTPNMSLLSEQEISKYSMFGNGDAFTEKIYFTLARFWDVLFHLFDYENYYKLLSTRYSETVPIYAFIFISIIFVSVYSVIKSVEFIDETIRPIIKLCVGIIIVQLLMYLTSIYPFMPSRHALVIFIPVVLIAALLISRIADYYFLFSIKEKYVYIVALFVAAAVLQFERVSSPPLDVGQLIVELEKRGVNRLILAPCDLEPALNRPKLSKFGLIYRCGSSKFDILNYNDFIVAVYSTKALTDDKAREVVNDYLADSHDRTMVTQKIRLTDAVSSFAAYQSEHHITIITVVR